MEAIGSDDDWFYCVARGDLRDVGRGHQLRAKEVVIIVPLSSPLCDLCVEIHNIARLD
jgi:hypothetical protein